MTTYGNREAILAKLLQVGDEGITDLGLSFAGGDWEPHVESLRQDGYPSIAITDYEGEETYIKQRITLPTRAAEAAACCMEIEALRQALNAEQAADPDPTTGYGDENKARLHRAMGRSLGGSVEVRRIMGHHGFNYDELAEFPEMEQVRNMVNAAWPSESLRLWERKHEAAAETA